MTLLGTTYNGGELRDAVNGLATPGQALIDIPFPSSIPRSEFFLPNDFLGRLEDKGSDSRAYAHCNYTAEQIFDLFSTARSAPVNTFVVDPTSGNDTTGNGLTEGTAWQTIGKAILAANATGQPAKIRIKGGQGASIELPKSKNFANGSSSTTYDPTVDIWFEFYGGLLIVGSHVDFSTPSLHTGASFTYACAVTTADNALDRLNVDEDGMLTPFQYVPWVASGDIPPGCWTTDGTTTLVRRADNSAVTIANTRVIQRVRNFHAGKNISIGMGPATSGDVMILEGGGGGNGPFDYVVPTSDTNVTPRCVAVRGVRFHGYGFLTTGTGRAVTVDALHGLAWFEDCFFGRSKTDHQNIHNQRWQLGLGVKTRALFVNCVGRKNGVTVNAAGLSNPLSANAHTGHEDVITADYAGDYRDSGGGCVRSIDSSKGIFAGTMAHDRGDRRFAGTTPPTAFRADDDAQFFLFRVRTPQMSPGSYAYMTSGSGSAIYLRDCWPDRGARMGNVSTW
ncbi:hypothetical protein [Caulobacter phage Cr30]|uniref:hydrolase n=1 Tax=Caulobacter phage Cr30 TaxID=1357714 RepID=UPI0004A9B917|nr:hydrolase [Caulobacter phage Cr30]AGS81038.1 hypothetical protein [Caulobacter phage Cr30]